MPETKPVRSVAERLQIHLIRTDGGTQPRAGIVEEKVVEYAEMMAAGTEMDPLLVYFDGSAYWLVDGFHRLAAARRSDFDTISCEVRQGTQADAQWASYSVNAKHGLPRTNDDKRRAVIAAFGHPKSAGMSDRALAAHCGVSDRFVAIVRREVPNCERFAVEKRTGLDGKARKMPARKAAAAQDPRWPAPNRFGVYAEDGVIEVPHTGTEGGRVVLRMLRIGESTWRSAWSITSSIRSVGNAIDVQSEAYESYEDATAGAASGAAAAIREWRGGPMRGEHRRELSMLLAWLCTMGAPPDVVESGPVEVDDTPVVIPPPAAGESMVLRHYREIQERRAGKVIEKPQLSPDAVELQRAITFLNQPLNWQSVAAELGVTDALRAQALKGRDVLDAIFQRAVKQLMSA